MNKLGTNFTKFIEYLKGTVSGTINTGIPQLDSFIRGLKGLVGIVGEPETCKSTLVLQIALYNASKGIPVFYIDAENGEHLTTERALCSLSGKSLASLGKLSEDRLKILYSKLSNLAFFYTNETDFEKLESDVKELSIIAKGSPMLLVIDSLQSRWLRGDNIRLVIDEWLQFLDSMKLLYDNKLVVLLTSEKARAAYGKAIQGAGKESGRIEYKLSQQLDIVKEGESLIMTCTKNRYGPSGGYFRLYKQFEDIKNPYSFLYKLECSDSVLD